jgi:phosphopantetheinyl transferase|uniref:4'-phosphopantetheinyl transferase domain-containing protein n=1 Tax=viral metagenome TaxID=1070528 RepID=A0A6C0ISP9_9ZZZZ
MNIENFIAKHIVYIRENILYLEINTLFIDNFDYLVTLFCNIQDITRLNKYILPKDKYRHLGSIILQKYITKKYTNISIEFKDLVIQRNNLFSQSECKPYILYPTDDDIVKYNISHDEDIVIAIFNAKSDVGIDIMSKNRIYQLNDINISHFKTEDKINKLQLWTLIEAYYKYNGMSISNIDNRNFYFDGSSNKFNVYNIDGNKKNNIIIESFEFVVNNINYIVSFI